MLVSAGQASPVRHPVIDTLTPTVMSRHQGPGADLALVEVSVEASVGVGADGDDMDTPQGDYLIL